MVAVNKDASASTAGPTYPFPAFDSGVPEGRAWALRSLDRPETALMSFTLRREIFGGLLLRVCSSRPFGQLYDATRQTSHRLVLIRSQVYPPTPGSFCRVGLELNTLNFRARSWTHQSLQEAPCDHCALTRAHPVLLARPLTYPVGPLGVHISLGPRVGSPRGGRASSDTPAYIAIRASSASLIASPWTHPHHAHVVSDRSCARERSWVLRQRASDLDPSPDLASHALVAYHFSRPPGCSKPLGSPLESLLVIQDHLGQQGLFQASYLSMCSFINLEYRDRRNSPFDPLRAKRAVCHQSTERKSEGALVRTRPLNVSKPSTRTRSTPGMVARRSLN